MDNNLGSSVWLANASVTLSISDSSTPLSGSHSCGRARRPNRSLRAPATLSTCLGAEGELSIIKPREPASARYIQTDELATAQNTRVLPGAPSSRAGFSQVLGGFWLKAWWLAWAPTSAHAGSVSQVDAGAGRVTGGTLNSTAALAATRSLLRAMGYATASFNQAVPPAMIRRAPMPRDCSGEGSRIALFLSSLRGGGVERSMLNLAAALAARGHRVDVVVCHARGALRDAVPAGVRVVVLRPVSGVWGRLRTLAADPEGVGTLLRPVLLPLKASTKIRYLPGLAHYLRREEPDSLLSAMTYPNLVALWARRLAAVRTRVVVSERNTLSSYVSHHVDRWRWRFVPVLASRMYRQADAIVAVAEGVATDLTRTTGIERARIHTIYNPVVTPDLLEKAKIPIAHPWFSRGSPPVILGVGRLEPNKDFVTLLRAFARLRRERKARLVVLGEGGQRPVLTKLTRELGIGCDVALPGWVENPFAFMSRAALFVLSSRWEGLPGALIQAMACGRPVVSTDCPGSREILDQGALGPLVPPGDDVALAHAINVTLANPPDSSRLRARAFLFTVERATLRYLELLS